FPSVSYTLSPLFLFTATAPSAIYTLSLHDALPIFIAAVGALWAAWETNFMGIQDITRSAADAVMGFLEPVTGFVGDLIDAWDLLDRKSTRLNSSHVKISYAVFCLKKKKKQQMRNRL